MKLQIVLRQATGSGAGFFLAAGVAFVAQIVLSDLLDAEHYGALAMVLTIATIGSQFTQLGFLRASTKLVSVAREKGDLSQLKAFLIFTLCCVALASTVGGIGLGLAISVLAVVGGAIWTYAATTGMLLLPLSLARVCSGILLGQQQSFLGAFAQTGAPHAGVLVGAFMLAALVGTSPMPEWMGAAVAAGAGVAVVVLLIGLAYSTRDAWAAPTGPFQSRKWLRLALPLMLVGTVQLMNRQIGTVVLGTLAGPESVAAFYPALRISEFATFGLIAVNAAVAARIATAWSNRDIALLQKTLTRAATLTLVGTVVIVALIWTVQSALLSLFSGKADDSQLALEMLLLGQIANAAGGSAGVLMAMAGQERFAAIVAILVLTANVFLHWLLVPPFGIEGAAIATSIAAVLWNGALIVRSVRVLGVNPTVFTRHIRALIR